MNPYYSKNPSIYLALIICLTRRHKTSVWGCISSKIIKEYVKSSTIHQAYVNCSNYLKFAMTSSIFCQNLVKTCQLFHFGGGQQLFLKWACNVGTAKNCKTLA